SLPVAVAHALHHAGRLPLPRPSRPRAEAASRAAASGSRGASASDCGRGGVGHKMRMAGQDPAIVIAAGAPDQTEKLVPQPQEAVAFGLLILNDCPIRSSTKSICEP